MTLRMILGIAIGMGAGALMGYFGKCSSGGCPLTANPYRGAIYGGLMGVLFAFSLAGSSKAPKGRVAPAAATKAAPKTALPEKQSQKGGGVVHVNSTEDFQRYVVNAEMPCLADFYSDRCGPCRMLAPTIEQLAQAYQGRAVICKVSLDAAPELAKPHRIMGIPAVLFFDAGHEVTRITGLRRQETYEQVLDTMITKHSEKTKEIQHADL